ncbi:MAG: type III pantothenate kinase [Eubacterium sp.]|nr:type III pantothenate kinase [Eubacterium sp.]
MILTVDVGNTTIRFCGVERQGDDYDMRFSVRTDTLRGKSGAEYLSELRQLLAREKITPDSFEGAVLCTVVPDLTDTMQICVRALIGKDAVTVTASAATGLTMAVPEPWRVGADRIADAAWAAAHYPLPAVTVDMGTATTFNVIDEGGVFLGGVIAAGLETGMRSLSDRAAQLPQIRLKTPENVIGKNTAECMLSGAVAGAAAMIDGITMRIEKELGKSVTLIITGGLAEYAEPLCTHPHHCDPDLLPKGMAEIYYNS